mmetsp:Transcript_16942/g.26408  ORF Transcript_16942/g.26408 Transcript_16942/m.26408 type:complete len:282 (+) Transcript_16942:828-1673(+)
MTNRVFKLLGLGDFKHQFNHHEDVRAKKLRAKLDHLHKIFHTKRTRFKVTVVQTSRDGLKNRSSNSLHHFNSLRFFLTVGEKSVNQQEARNSHLGGRILELLLQKGDKRIKMTLNCLGNTVCHSTQHFKSSRADLRLFFLAEVQQERQQLRPRVVFKGQDRDGKGRETISQFAANIIRMVLLKNIKESSLDNHLCLRRGLFPGPEIVFFTRDTNFFSKHQRSHYSNGHIRRKSSQIQKGSKHLVRVFSFTSVVRFFSSATLLIVGRHQPSKNVLDMLSRFL